MTLSTAPFESRMRISPRRKQTWPFAISNIVDHAKFYSRSHDAVSRVYNESGNVIEAHEHAGDFKEWWAFFLARLPRGQKKLVATAIAATVTQLTAAHVLRSKWTWKSDYIGTANAPKIQVQATRFFSRAVNAE